MGYSRAGFDVVGVDIRPQPRYPFEFRQGDALAALERALWYQREGRRASDYDLGDFDAIHASPPCQAYSRMTSCRPGNAETHPDLIGPTRELLDATGLPYVIENVPGSPLRAPLKLCGCQFGLRSPRGLGVRRERWFETNWPLYVLLPPHNHEEPALPVTGHSPGKEWRQRNRDLFGRAPGATERREAMGVPWMTRDEATEAIPPAMTELIGHHLLSHVRARSAA